MRRLSLIVLFALTAITLSAESTPIGRGFFRYAQFGHSLYADMHPNFVRLDIPYCTNHPAYDYNNDGGNRMRLQTMGLFGVNLPIWTGNVVDSTYALAVNWQMSANLWMDFFEKVTSPIMDTDYRIGFPTFTFLHRLNYGFFKNYSAQWSPFKHESTHLGDELQIRYIDRGYAIRRINVSYNYTEFVFTLNEAEDRYAENHCIRFGLMILLHGGWFNMNPDAGDQSLIDPRGTGRVPYGQRRPWEAFLQYQYQSPTSRHGFQGIASIEVRNRECYGYDLTVLTTDYPKRLQPEKRVFTYNVFIGARYNIPGYDGYFSRFALGLRAYYGNCPYGQFRSIDKYSQIGVCMVFE